MFVQKWDNFTLILYVFIAVLVSLLFKISIIAKEKKQVIDIFKIRLEKKYLYYFLIYLILIIFLVFRKIAPGIGGTDTPTYMSYFDNLGYVKFDIKSLFLFNDFEYVFFNLMYLTRILGGNYLHFSFIVYSGLILSYIYVIDKTFNKKDDWIWSVLLFIPILSSMNIIRNCISAALCFVAIQKLNEKKDKKFWLYAILGFLNHYIAIVIFVLYFFVKFFPEKWIDTGKKYCIWQISIIVLSILSIPLLNYFISLTGYGGYVSKFAFSIWGYIPYILLYMFIAINFKDISKYFKVNNNYVYFKSIIFLGLLLPIFVSIGGANRLLLFFDLPRIVIYINLVSFIFTKYKNKFFNNDKPIKLLIFIVLMVWLIFRIYRMWNNYGIMPYYNILFY